jgi:hypothetical protein
VTRCVCEKSPKYRAQPIFGRNWNINFTSGKKSSQTIWLLLEFQKQQFKENNRPIGENAPNRVALVSNEIRKNKIFGRHFFSFPVFQPTNSNVSLSFGNDCETGLPEGLFSNQKSQFG